MSPDPRAHQLLVVESDWLKREIILEALEQGSYQAVGCTSAEEAIDKLPLLWEEERPVVVVVIDKTSRESSVTVGRFVKAYSPKTLVIWVSDYGNSHGLPEVVDWGMYWPLRINELTRALEFLTQYTNTQDTD